MHIKDLSSGPDIVSTLWYFKASLTQVLVHSDTLTLNKSGTIDGQDSMGSVFFDLTLK